MVVIRHKEYIGDVLTGSLSGGLSVFNLQQFFFNPGQAGTFPWLSTIAGNYLHCKIHNLTFLFNSTSATALNSTNTALGIVALRVQYDPTVGTDSSLIQMQNAYDCHIANPSQHIVYECDGLEHRQLTVRTGAQPANTDLRMYEEGYLEVVTQGMQAASTNIGQLWVVYEFEFYDEIYIQGEIGSTIRSCLYTLTGWANATPLGTPAAQRTDSIGMTFANGVTISFPKSISTGRYLLVFDWVGAGTAVIAYPGFTPTNCSIVGYWSGNNSVTAPTAGETASRVSTSIVVDINAPGYTQASIALGAGGTLPATPGAGYLAITQINNLSGTN